MAYLALIFFVIVVIFLVFDRIDNASKQRDGEIVLRELFDKGEPHREITAEEEAIIQPFLAHPHKPGKFLSLKGKGVYSLSGEYTCYKLDKGYRVLYETLGNVEVILPYYARLLMSPWNTAEVVLTDTMAIVITLNDQFDITEAHNRAEFKQVQDRQWAEGQTGELLSFSEVDDDLTLDSVERSEIPPVRILGQRDETPAEISLRVNSGLGWFYALLLITGFVLWLIGAYSTDGYLGWLISSVLLFAAALYGIWWPRRTLKSKKVNRVKGCLTGLSLQNPHNSIVLNGKLYLGHTFWALVPKQWAERITAPAIGIVDIDVRVSDFFLLRFGDALSLDKEEQLFPSVYWGRHLLLMIVSFAVTIMVGFIVKGSISDDVAHIQAVLHSQNTPVFRQPSQLLAHPPQVGSIVHIESQARCQLVPAKSYKPEPINCTTLRWGGGVPTLSAVKIAPDILSIYQAEIINAGIDYTVGMILEANHLTTRGMFQAKPKVYTIDKLSHLVKTIDQFCKDKNTITDKNNACRYVQSLLGRVKVHFGYNVILDAKQAQSGMGWPRLVAYARLGHANDPTDAISLEQNTMRDLKRAVTAMAEPQVHDAYVKELTKALAAQRGGVLVPNPKQEAHLAQPPSEPDLKSTNWLQQWAQYQELAQAKYLKSVDLKGLVLRSEKNQQGDWVLEVDQRRTQENVVFAKLRLAALLLASLFVLIHGSLFYIKLRQAKKRDKAIEHYRNQQARGGLALPPDNFHR